MSKHRQTRKYFTQTHSYTARVSAPATHPSPKTSSFQTSVTMSSGNATAGSSSSSSKPAYLPVPRELTTQHKQITVKAQHEGRFQCDLDASTEPTSKIYLHKIKNTPGSDALMDRIDIVHESLRGTGPWVRNTVTVIQSKDRLSTGAKVTYDLKDRLASTG